MHLWEALLSKILECSQSLSFCSGNYISEGEEVNLNLPNWARVSPLSFYLELLILWSDLLWAGQLQPKDHWWHFLNQIKRREI